jgi:hypothetical protein
MINQASLNKFVDTFISIASSITADKAEVLENFRIKEAKLREYSECLTNLEKQQSKINLSEFEGLREKTLDILKKFDPVDIDSNIVKVMETVNFFKSMETEFLEVSESILGMRKSWITFIENNVEFRYSKFSDYFDAKEASLKNLFKVVNPREIGVLNADIDIARQDMEMIIITISKIKELASMNIFIGEKAKQIEAKILNLLHNYESVEIFMSTAKELITEVETDSEQELGTVAIEVIRFENAEHKYLHMYTVLFGDFVLKYDTFFNIDNFNIVKTGKYIFLDNYPIEGIFNGRNIVENLDYNDAYVESVADFKSNAFISFLAIISIIGLSTMISMFIGGIAVYLNFFISLFLIILFNPILSFIETQSFMKNGMSDGFIFSSENYIVAKKGYDTDMDAILLGILQNFDNTILNQKFHEEGSTYR